MSNKITSEQDLQAAVNAYQLGGKEQWCRIISPLARTGLYLKLSTSRGAVRASYVYRYKSTIGQYQRKLTLGSIHNLTYAEALSEHFNLSKRVANDEDPAGEKHKARALATATASNAKTFAELTAQFIEHKAKQGVRPATIENLVSVSNRYLIPKLGNLPLKDITPAHIKTCKDIAGKVGIGAQELQTLQTAKQILAYGCNELLLDYNPARELKADFKRRSRAEAWDDEQLKTIIEEIVTTDKPNSLARSARICFWLLLVSGARRLEILHLRKDEVTFAEDGGALLTISAERVKVNRPYYVYLPTYSASLLKEAMDLAGESELVFPSPYSAKKPRQGSSFTKSCTNIMREHGIPGCVHTTRHSLISTGVRMGLDAMVVDSLTGHAQITGVGKHYLHLTGVTERQVKAWQAIEAHLIALKDGAEAQPNGAKVLRLAGRRAVA